MQIAFNKSQRSQKNILTAFTRFLCFKQKTFIPKCYDCEASWSACLQDTTLYKRFYHIIISYHHAELNGAELTSFFCIITLLW